MLDRVSSRRLLADAEQNAYTVLQVTPDDPDYVASADALARQLLQLSEYLGQLDAVSAGKTATPVAFKNS